MKRYWLVCLGVLVASVVMATSVALAETPPVGGNAGNPGNQARAMRGISVVSRLTGMTTDEIRAARGEGKSLAQIAAANGVSQESLVKGILAERRAFIDRQVEAGRITREKADAWLIDAEQRVTANVTRTICGTGDYGGCAGCALRPGAGAGRGMGRGAGRGVGLGARN